MKFIPKKNPFIIAEIGSNFKTKEDCLNSIPLAKSSGADAVKFQLYTHKDLYGFDGEIEGALPKEWIRELKKQADLINIKFMCSAFSEDLIEFIDPFVDCHKLASSEMCHVKMLEKLNQKKKPVFMSTGAQHRRDILKALTILSDVPICLMYCVASYPARMTNLQGISELEKTFDWCSVGFSDHSLEVYSLANEAVEMGCVAIEKHVSFIEEDTPDRPHSLDANQFKQFCKVIKEGLPPWNPPTIEESEMIRRHKRRLKAMTAIKVGELLEYGKNFGIFRSKTDDIYVMSPFDVHRVEGKRSKLNLNPGDGISPNAI